jgi:hypothetical protein
MARYTRSGLGLVPPKESEFNYKYIGTATSSEISSLFSSEHRLIPGSDESNNGIFESPLTFKNLHTDERYDLSTTNIIKNLSGSPALKLKYSDFVYCRDYGVYPNNRLIIVRRFGGPVGDNLTGKSGSPVGTLVTWFDDQSPPIAIDFGINWDEAEVSFKNVLNNIGKDFGLNKIPGLEGGLGEYLGAGANLGYFPGAFEPFTRQIFEGMGIIGPGGADFIPSGSPTLIKEAKQRKLIGDDTPGSSLKGSISVAIKCAWEQKFIGGIDPTKVYYDLLRMILHFGSDDASFYLGSGSTINSVLGRILKLLENPVDFIKQMLESFQTAFAKVIQTVKDSITKFFNDQLKKIPEDTSKNAPENETDQQRDERLTNEQNADLEEQKNKALSLAGQALGKIAGLFTTLTKGLARKYKHVLLGIGNALSGAPSTPWHVTVGNPFRPILSSGDMYMDSVKLTLGPTLAFNDLPSFVEVEFTLQSARNLGANEIFRKLHTGEVRISSKQKKTFYVEEEESDVSTVEGPEAGVPANSGIDESTQRPVEPALLNKTIVGSTPATGTTASNGSTINSDPNSPLPAVVPPAGSTVQTVTPPITTAQEVNLSGNSGTLFGTTTEPLFTAPSAEPPAPPAEGSVAQKITTETPPAPNENATQPVQEPEPQASNWVPGEVVAKGTVYYEGEFSGTVRPSINWEVYKTRLEGRYSGEYDDIITLGGNNLASVVEMTKNDAQDWVNSGHVEGE